MHPLIWWAATAVVFFTLELSTASFFFLWIGAGAVITALTSLFVRTGWIQYVVFGASSLLLVALSRRLAPRLSGKPQRPSNVDSLVGLTALVLKVEPNQSDRGTVKVEGETWMAESQDRSPLVPGGRVGVVSVRGNVLVVKA
jgi:membrane protein implicated in regulation of membrane protease activity